MGEFTDNDSAPLDELNEWLQLLVFTVKSQPLLKMRNDPDIIALFEGIHEAQCEVEILILAVQMKNLCPRHAPARVLYRDSATKSDCHARQVPRSISRN